MKFYYDDFYCSSIAVALGTRGNPPTVPKSRYFKEEDAGGDFHRTIARSDCFLVQIIAPEDLFDLITDEQMEYALFRDSLKVAFSPDETAVEPDSPHLGTQNQAPRPSTDEELELYTESSQTRRPCLKKDNRLGLFNNYFLFVCFLCGLIFCGPHSAEDEVYSWTQQVHPNLPSKGMAWKTSQNDNNVCNMFV